MKKHLLPLIFLSFLVSAARADLIHRYSFDGSKATFDSVGVGVGVYRGGASGRAGAVHLAGDNDYIQLSSALLEDLTTVSFECWFTYTDNGAWARVFDFGGTNPSTGMGRNYIFYTPRSSAGTSRLVISDADPGNNHEEIINAPVPAQGGPVFIACVYDGDKHRMSLYVDGTPVGSIAVTIPLSAVEHEFSYLGRSLYPDPYLSGSIDEFRVYDHALNNEEVLLHYTLGPERAGSESLATQPHPAHQAADVAVSTVLGWTAPLNEPDAVTVYWGTNPDLRQTRAVDVTDGNSCPVALSYDTTYYWRVDTRYGDTTYSSRIWQFTTSAAPVDVSPVGDLNGDFRIDCRDMDLFAGQWLNGSECRDPGCADFDGQGGVNFSDFVRLAQNWGKTFPAVVINEIHYHPDDNTEPVEFVELHNASSEPVDLAGWYFDGVTYVFPPRTEIAAGDYVVVGEDPRVCRVKFGVKALGPFAGKLSNEGEHLVLYNAAGDIVDEVDYGSDFPWPIAANGEGASMELIHPGLDNDLAGSWRSSGYHADHPEAAFGPPTPGARNSVYNGRVAPQIRQVHHTPEQPLSGELVTISAKVTDPDGVNRVLLRYQVVSPGQYIPARLPVPVASLMANPEQPQPMNPAFEDAAHWCTLTMVDDGTGADAVAADHTYTVVVDGQINRTLLRYRIVVEDNNHASIQVPYADDASLNFAYYVYDGVPDYVAGTNSVHPDGPGHVYSSEILTSIPVYTLITRADDIYQCNGYDAADRIAQGTSNLNNQYAGRAYNWEGALVYEGKVYDHIGYRLRGGNGRYNYAEQGFNNAGKRSMKFRFNRGNYFQARDLFGDLFPSKWQHLNTGKMYGNQLAWARYRNYPYGLNEVMDMRLFELADVPAYKTWWIHFRVVDGPEEAPAGINGQYEGDFWGLYLALENYDGAFLERLGLPKGNLYKLSDKIYEGPDQLRYQGPNAVEDASDYENIRWNLTHEASADFIREYLDCDEWYRYHTITEAIRHFDIFSGATCVHCLKNSAWFFYPDYSTNPWGRLQFLPFDVDDTWGPYFNMGVDHAKAAIYDQRFLGGLEQFPADPEKSPLKRQYRSVIRAFRDLQWQPEVINGMIDELTAVIADFVPADRDRWRHDRTVPGDPIDNGSLEDCVALMKQFAWSSGSFPGGFYWEGTAAHLDNLADEEGDAMSIPRTPTIDYLGAAGYPLNDLWFETSAFSDPQGAGTFGALQWRIGAYELNYRPAPIEETTLLKPQSEWAYFKGTAEPSATPDAWRQGDFQDGDWQIGQTPIGYSDNDDLTDLSLDTPPMRGNYTTVYLRNTFNVTDKDQVQRLILSIYVDDGCIVWINGTEVKRMYCSSGYKPHDSLTGETDHEAVRYEDVVLPGPYDYLVNGTNVIAVHALQTTTTSSDFSIDVSVRMSTRVPEPPTLGPSRYELHALWQSEELTDPADRAIQIPGEVVKPGRTYRVRCRMQDNTGRWSHWSQPAEFIAGPAVAADLLNYLRISELMYNPLADAGGAYNNDDFEFIELKNISGTATLDLSTLSIRDGVTFDFAGSRITGLNPGETVLVVSNEGAFVSRYGQDASSRIAGTYSGQFANSGERVEIVDAWNGPVMCFTYNDNGAWPDTADGGGCSLVPRDNLTLEALQAGILDDPTSWQADLPSPGR